MLNVGLDKMGKQLNIFETKYSFNMAEQKVGMLCAEIEKLKQELQKKDNTIRTYKGHFTKLKNKYS
jgi:uncharacterized small protein (DUF1192 family)